MEVKHFVQDVTSFTKTIVLFNSHERSELTPKFNSPLTPN